MTSDALCVFVLACKVPLISSFSFQWYLLLSTFTQSCVHSKCGMKDKKNSSSYSSPYYNDIFSYDNFWTTPSFRRYRVNNIWQSNNLLLQTCKFTPSTRNVQNYFSQSSNKHSIFSSLTNKLFKIHQVASNWVSTRNYYYFASSSFFIVYADTNDYRIPYRTKFKRFEREYRAGHVCGPLRWIYWSP